MPQFAIPRSFTLGAATIVFASACTTTPPLGELKVKSENATLVRDVVKDYTELSARLYADAIASAKSLQVVTKAFTDKPSAVTLAAAQSAWKDARRYYSYTAALRFFGGPIDHAETGPEGLLNAWPLDEAYIDYVKGSPKGGIVQNPAKFATFDKALLTSLNEKDGEKNISTGYHAVEFLLWGQDFSTSGPGQRSYKDYDVKSNPYAARRATYLNLLNELIVEHLEAVATQWTPAGTNYRAEFEREALGESLRKIFTGLTSLSVDEMAGERLTVALEIHDQENEQDCFSDFSLRDSAYNQDGIAAVYFNAAPGMSEAERAKRAPKSIAALVRAENPELAKRIEAQFQKVSAEHLNVEKIGTLDKIVAARSEKSAGRVAVRRLIAELNAQGSLLGAAGKQMGLVLNVETEAEAAAAK